MPRDQRLYMTFPIDFWTHPKVSRLSDAAFRAFVEANGHSRMRESDGRIESADAEFLWPAGVLAELVASHPVRPLLTTDGSEYVLRDYAEHQFTKADRDTLTEKRRKAGIASANKRSTHVEQAPTDDERLSTRKGIGKEITTKTPRTTPVGRGSGGEARGTRIPDEFYITGPMKEWAVTNVPGLDLAFATRQFVDYWRSDSTAKATKRDWVAAWRFWMSRDHKQTARKSVTRTEENMSVVARIAAREQQEQRELSA